MFFVNSSYTLLYEITIVMNQHGVVAMGLIVPILITANNFMTRESYRLVENSLHFYTLIIYVYILILRSHTIRIIQIRILSRSCFYLLSHITLLKSHGLFLYFITFHMVPFYYIIVMHANLHFITPLHLHRSSPYPLLLCIQTTTHVLIFQLAHTHNSHNHTSMSSFRSLSQSVLL